VPPPLIVTAELDPPATERLDALRRAHFPPERLQVGAHLTLFHQLPGEEEEAVRADLAAAAASRPVPAATIAGVRLLGRGVAFDVDAPELVRTRAALAETWAPWLVAQDRGWGRPHVTVQNKVAPEVARALHETLSHGFEPWPARAEALGLWRYLGGPWEAVARVGFGG